VLQIVSVFVALIIQHAMRVRHIVICGLPRCTVFYLKNGTIFENMLLNTECMMWFPLQILSETFHILRRIERDVIKMYIVPHVKNPLFLSDFNETWIISTVSRKVLKYQVSLSPSSGSRVVPCGQTDGRTGMMKLVVAFRNFAEAPKKCAHMAYPGTSLPCPQGPRACPSSEPDESSPHHYTSFL